jgi:hypothetical protein
MEQDLRIYIAGLTAFGLVGLVTAVWIFRLGPENVGRWEKIPRSLVAGMPFAVVSLFWCIPHAKPLLPDSLHVFLLPTAIFCAAATFFLLDFVFSRALGGFLVLLAYYFLHASFTYHTPVKPLFSLFCYGMGIVGLFLCGKPWLLRDWIRRFSSVGRDRCLSACLVGVFAVFCLALSAVHVFLM